MGDTLKINICDQEGNIFDTITMDTDKVPRKEENTNLFLDTSIARDFRNVITSSMIFAKSEKLKEKYNLICVVMDRLTSAINYLNAHDAFPECDESFICFLVYASMVKDAISKLYENIYQKKPTYLEETKYFKDVKQYGINVFSNETCPTDDVFFEYLRSMAFAHPFETSGRKRPFLEENEKQYCPWVIVSDNQVGIRVYTSSDKFVIQDLTFSFDTLKAYIRDRYEYLSVLKKWAEDEIDIQDQEWLTHKVDRKDDVFETIKSIRQIYDERFLETYHIDCIETYLKCQSTNCNNNGNVLIFKNALRDSVSKICDALDTLDYNALDKAIAILRVTPKNAYPILDYHLSKIFSYLDEDSDFFDIKMALSLVDDFSQRFVKKWVTIDTQTMSFDEIKLLVQTACYLEAMDENE